MPPVRNLLNIPNAITSLRLLLFPVIWWFAVNGAAEIVGGLVAFCLLSDFADGFAARLLKQSTSFGAKLDSFADNLMLLSVVPWIKLTLPVVWLQHFTALGALLVLLLVVFVIMAFKFKRNVEIHTYLSKVGICIMWTYFVWSLWFGSTAWFFYLFIFSSFAYLTEDIYLLLTRAELNEHEKGLLFNRKIKSVANEL